MSNTAIILAAGNGTRMKADKSKLLLEINNMTVIERTVKTFSSIDEIDNIIVVVRENDIPLFKDVLLKYNVTYCIGGNSRQESVSNAVKVIDACDLLIFHDGARPLVTDAVICRAVSKAKKFAAAAPAVRVKDTIKVSTGGAVDETPDRSTLYAVQTPQVFDRDLLAAALQNAKEQGIALTDDCSAVEALGMPVQLTDGDEENLKITTPLDLELAALILRRRANA